MSRFTKMIRDRFTYLFVNDITPMVIESFTGHLRCLTYVFDCRTMLTLNAVYHISICACYVGQNFKLFSKLIFTQWSQELVQEFSNIKSC